MAGLGLSFKHLPPLYKKATSITRQTLSLNLLHPPITQGWNDYKIRIISPARTPTKNTKLDRPQN